MKYFNCILLGMFILVTSATWSLAVDNLSHKLEMPAKINAEPIIQLNTRNAAKMIGPKGIIMGTCRQLPGKAMLLQGSDNRSYQLPDGVYENSQGFRIHVRMGGIEQISISSKLAR